MSKHRERLGFLGLRSRAAEGAEGAAAIAARAPLAAAVMAACCLAAAGCSAATGLTGHTVVASTAATAVPPNGIGPPADPFTGTPADRWADGARAPMHRRRIRAVRSG